MHPQDIAYQNVFADSLLVLVFCLLVLGLHTKSSFAQSTQVQLHVRELMTTEQFQSAGLNKLTQAELVALDRWFTETAGRIIEIDQSNQRDKKSAPAALDFASLEGATIIADDGQFLGEDHLELNR